MDKLLWHYKEDKMNVYRIFLNTDQSIDIFATSILDAVTLSVSYLRQQGNENIDDTVISQIHLISTPIFFEEPTQDGASNVS